jgi:hypothetical protein
VGADKAFNYDANGLISGRSVAGVAQEIVYDQDNRPSQVKVGGVSVYTFAYDDDGVRRKRTAATATVHYVGGFEKEVTSGVVTKHYAAPFGKQSRPVAFAKGGMLSYLGTDHLGSTIAVANAAFAAIDQMRYKPYGEDRDTGASLSTDHKFTSQIQDKEIGLYWYNVRAYV